MLQQVVVGLEPVANVLLNVGRLALERVERVELARGYRVLHPRNQLLVADNPHVLHVGGSGSPVEELVEHVDLVDRILETGIASGEMDRVRVDTERLSLAIVMIGESVLHPGKHVGSVGSVEPRVHEMGTRSSTLVKDGIHRNLPEAGQLRLSTANIGDRVAIVGHTVIERVGPESVRVGVCNRHRGGRTRVISESSAGQVLEVGTTVVEEGRTVADNRLVRDTCKCIERDEIAVDFGVGSGLLLVSHSVIANIVAVDIELGDLSVIGVIERDEVRHEWCTAVGVLALCEELVDRVDRVVLHSIVGGEDNELRHVFRVEATRRVCVGAVTPGQLAGVGVAAVSSSGGATTSGHGLALAARLKLPLLYAQGALYDGLAALVEKVATMRASYTSEDDREQREYRGRLHRDGSRQTVTNTKDEKREGSCGGNRECELGAPSYVAKAG